MHLIKITVFYKRKK